MRSHGALEIVMLIRTWAAALLMPISVACTAGGRQAAALTEMMRAVNAGDARGYAAVYAPDARITIYGGGELKGREAIERYEADLLREYPGTRFAIYSVWQRSMSAVVHYGVSGRTAAGQAMGHEGLLFYRFRPSGEIEEERRYLDSMTPMAQMGLLGAHPARHLPTLSTEMNNYVARRTHGEDQNVALVTSSLTSLELKNREAFLITLADDAVIDELIQPEPYAGKQKVKVWFDMWTTAIPDARSEITSIIGVGDFVLVESVVRGTLKGPLGGVAAANRPFSVHRAEILQMKDGKLARISAFMNGKELAEAVGQWPP